MSLQQVAAQDVPKSNGKEFRPLGDISPPRQAADPAYIASLVASHDAGLAFLGERRKGKA